MTKPEGPASTAEMSAHERDQWERLQAYWSKRANPRGTPKWLTDGARSVAGATGKAAKGAATAVGKAVPDTVKEAAGKVLGDEKLKREGQADRVAGKVQNTVGGVKDAIRDERRTKH